MRHLFTLLLLVVLAGCADMSKERAYLYEAYRLNTVAYGKCLDAAPTVVPTDQWAAMCDRRWNERRAELADLGQTINGVGQIPTVFTPPRYIQ